MRVLNPIFDTAFKYLMEDIEIARELIALIIDMDVVELYPAPQERTNVKLTIKYSQLALQHLDYVAVIKTIDENGIAKFEKVMVEVQKSPFKPAIGRFRKYVAEKYKHQSALPETKSKGKKQKKQPTAYLPLKTIYFIEETFNDKLPGILHRQGKYINALDKKTFEGERDEFVELLNHDSWFIQLHQLPFDLKNRIIRILSVFTDWYRDKDDSRYINYPNNDIEKIKDRLLRRIIHRLLAAAADEELKLQIELEIEYNDNFENLLTKLDSISKEKEEAKAREEEAKAREEEANKVLATAIINLLKAKMTVEQIALIMNLPAEKIKNIIEKANE